MAADPSPEQVIRDIGRDIEDTQAQSQKQRPCHRDRGTDPVRHTENREKVGPNESYNSLVSKSDIIVPWSTNVQPHITHKVRGI